ncbi:MAG TPA: hypothetical protein ENN87_04910 [Phycisphaerales bacterium]|nr:hypothetical protein [Phycisphaerales bacterium]
MREITCYRCGHSFSVPDEYAGRNVPCRNCEALNSVPANPGSSGTRLFDHLDERGQDLLEQRFDRLLQALSEYERRAPALKT